MRTQLEPSLFLRGDAIIPAHEKETIVTIAVKEIIEDEEASSCHVYGAPSSEFASYTQCLDYFAEKVRSKYGCAIPWTSNDNQCSVLYFDNETEFAQMVTDVSNVQRMADYGRQWKPEGRA